MEQRKNTYRSNTDEVELVTAVEFVVSSNDDHLKYSVIPGDGITSKEVDINGESANNGVNDKRLGVNGRNEVCGTCPETSYHCPGHFGHTKLADPVFHMGYLPFIKKILAMICVRCYKLLVNKNEATIARIIRNKISKQRFADVSAACKKVTFCANCGTPAHNIVIEKRNGEVQLIATPIKNMEADGKQQDKKKSSRIISPAHCRNLLRSISNTDYEIMGFDTTKTLPGDMIIEIFPIPPVPVHPSVKMEIGSSTNFDDDITRKLKDIIYVNEGLKNSKGSGAINKDVINYDMMMTLQVYVARYFDNDSVGLSKLMQKNNKGGKSISDRIKGKDGRVRGNLAGKRVDFSARTVITSDPYLALNEVGIPLKIAMNLTFPEIVTEYNREYLQQLVINGPDNYPGANYVHIFDVNEQGSETETVLDLEYVRSPVVLQIGNVVDRHLINGDPVLFNRQPSLHKMSMMGHKAHIIDDPLFQTFRVNVNVTTPYNADFDGDEMNIHIPQSPQTIAELLLIANAAKRMVSPTTSKMGMGGKQDSLMGSYTQTLPTTRIDWKDSMNMLMATSKGLSADIPKNTKLAGSLVYSEIIPKTLNTKVNKDGSVLLSVVNGLIVDGILNSDAIASLVHNIWIGTDSESTKNFIDDMQRMTLQYLMLRGYTVSIEDTVVSDAVKETIQVIIETIRKSASELITQHENDPYVISEEAHEAFLRETLKASSKKVQDEIMANLNKNAGLYTCILSGSSGAALNATQIIGCVGQVIVESKRIQKKYNERTLPCFAKHDDSAFARGFCRSSFMSGLTPPEFFFHVIGGREGIINTAIKTADTGYVQRKVTKTLEDIKAEYDGTVRNASGRIIQYVYGDNGISTEKQVKQKIGLLGYNNQQVRDIYIYTQSELKAVNANSKGISSDLNNKLYNKMLTLRDKLRDWQKKIAISNGNIALNEVFMVPVDLKQAIEGILNKPERSGETVDPHYVLKVIRDLYSSELTQIMKFNNNSKIKKADDQVLKLVLKTYLYDILGPKKVTNVYKMSKDEFDDIADYFVEKYSLAKVEGGEMVGNLAAQGVGEPVTQTNLKSFHKSGVGKTVSSGLARIKELLNISKVIKTPVTTIVLEEKYKTNKLIASRIAANLKFTTLKDVVDVAEIVYDPDLKVMQRDGVTEVFDVSASKGKTGCQNNANGLPYALRLTLSKDKMNERDVKLLEIKTSFCANWSARYDDSKNRIKEYKRIIDKITQTAIVTNFDNSETPMVHVRFNVNNYNQTTLIQFLDMVVNKYRIKGIDGITDSSTLRENQYVDFDAEGNVVEKKQWVIEADGLNISEISKMNGIDMTFTTMNSIVSIYNTYGVEAARNAFIREFTLGIESSDGFSNYQHVEILADLITQLGDLTPIDRRGISKVGTGPLMKASFEKTMEQFLSACAFSEVDHMRSVSSKVLTGHIVNGGTGAFDVLLDHDAIKKTLIMTKGSSTEEESETLVPAPVFSSLIKRKKNKS
jgi:DNA-directed RNA polymerase II subunit RPB1